MWVSERLCKSLYTKRVENFVTLNYFHKVTCSPSFVTSSYVFLFLRCVFVPQMCFCFVGLPLFPSASWPLSFLSLFFLFLRPCLIHARMPDWGRAFVHGHTFLHSWTHFLAFMDTLQGKQTVLALYRALVRPLLEYGAQFWSPIRRVDVERLEKVQARATKLVPSIRHKGYQRRLADLGLFTLEQRRLRGLLIETFKILRGFSGLDPASVFELSVNRTRNHGYKVVPPRFNTVLYRDFPTVRVCNLWNSLPEAVVNAPSVDAFKGRLDKILPGLAF